jgi:hypothetical protein
MNAGNWQTWAVYVVVFVTVGIFVWRLARSVKMGSGCGGSCGCEGKSGFKRHEVIEEIIRHRR